MPCFDTTKYWNAPDPRALPVPHTHEIAAFWDRILKDRGWVYCLSGPDGSLKIGFTRKNPFVRAKQLGSSGTLHTFDVLRAYYYLRPHWAERLVHADLADFRIGKEFFSCNVAAFDAAAARAQRLELERLQRCWDVSLLPNDTTNPGPPPPEFLAHGFLLDAVVDYAFTLS